MSDRDTIAALQRNLAESERGRLALLEQRDALLDALKWMSLEKSECHRCKRMGGTCVAHEAIEKAEGTS
jgi:hypothetical protein